jgi:hypothetical protein
MGILLGYMKDSHYITLTILFAGGVIALSIFSGTQLAKEVSLETQPDYPAMTADSETDLPSSELATASGETDSLTDEDEEDVTERMRYVGE